MLPDSSYPPLPLRLHLHLGPLRPPSLCLKRRSRRRLSICLTWLVFSRICNPRSLPLPRQSQEDNGTDPGMRGTRTNLARPLVLCVRSRTAVSALAISQRSSSAKGKPSGTPRGVLPCLTEAKSHGTSRGTGSSRKSRDGTSRIPDALPRPFLPSPPTSTSPRPTLLSSPHLTPNPLPTSPSLRMRMKRTSRRTNRSPFSSRCWQTRSPRRTIGTGIGTPRPDSRTFPVQWSRSLLPPSTLQRRRHLPPSRGGPLPRLLPQGPPFQPRIVLLPPSRFPRNRLLLFQPRHLEPRAVPLSQHRPPPSPRGHRPRPLPPPLRTLLRLPKSRVTLLLPRLAICVRPLRTNSISSRLRRKVPSCSRTWSSVLWIPLSPSRIGNSWLWPRTSGNSSGT